MSEEDQITTKQASYINDLTKGLTDEVVRQHIQKPVEDLTKQEASNIIEALKELPENAPLSKANVPPVAKDVKVETVSGDIHILTNEEKEYYKQKLVSSRAIVKACAEEVGVSWTSMKHETEAVLISAVFNKIAKDKYYLYKGE